MYSILVLGLIPGTNIAISFDAWLGAMTVLIGTIAILRIELRNRAFAPRALSRIVLHASQLHQRA
jgi:hypothetical protein